MPKTTITALHIYHPNQFQACLTKLEPALAISREFWVSSAKPALLDTARRASVPYGLPIRTFTASNAWHDWSGFLAFLDAGDPMTQLIIANDSITTRRILGRRSVCALVQASVGRARALVGELDTASESVTLQGESSACWISTYLFAISGIRVDTTKLEALVSEDVAQILRTPEHFFLRYLSERRPSLTREAGALRAKLGAMCFERHLTRIAKTQGADVVHAFAGNRLRKLERLLERQRDA